MNIRFLARSVAHLAALSLMALLASCGGHGGGGATNIAYVRFINATSAGTLSVALSGSAVFNAAAPGSTSGYSSLTAGTYTVAATSSNGALTSASQAMTFASGDYAIIAYDRDGAIFLASLAENIVAPAAGTGTFSLANTSPDTGLLDVYVVPAGTASLAGFSPIFNTSSLGTTTLTVGSTYDVYAVASGSKTDIRYKLAGLTTASTQVETLVLTGTPGGALANGMLIIQAGAVTFSPNPFARVRLFSALPQAGGTAIVATVGTTTLPTVVAPVQGSYTPVTGGANTYSVTVAGAAVATLPANTFVAGGDYTILVYGSAGSPVVTVLTDNNQSAGVQANIRLVNVGVTSGGLALSDNFASPVITGVAYGTSSGYVGVPPAASPVIQILAPSSAPLTLTAVPGLSAGEVYTIFVIDSALTYQVVRDR